MKQQQRSSQRGRGPFRGMKEGCTAPSIVFPRIRIGLIPDCEEDPAQAGYRPLSFPVLFLLAHPEIDVCARRGFRNICRLIFHTRRVPGDSSGKPRLAVMLLCSMASAAVILYAEGPLRIMACAAILAFLHIIHRSFVAHSGHGEEPVAFNAL